MKPFLILSLFLSLQVSSQEAFLRVEITDSKSEFPDYVSASVRLVNNDTLIPKTTGFRITLRKSLSDTLIATHWAFGTVKQFFSIKEDSVGEITIRFPKSCKDIPNTTLCPVCKSRKNVIPIAYGDVGMKTFERVEQGKVWLGECMWSPCSPGHYCTTDNFSF